MGGVVSGQESSVQDHKSVDEIVQFILPIYHVKVPLLPYEREKLVKSWKLLTNNHATEFYRMKKEDPVNTPCSTPMEYFANRFYRRLVEIHPTCQPMFSKSSAKQGRLLMNMFSLIVGEVEEDSQEKFKKTLQTLATCHNRVGVRAAEYSIFGEVLFWTLRHTLGQEVYDTGTHTAWVKLYSRMLDIIIPIVVEYEQANYEAIQRVQCKRLQPILQISNTMILPADAHSTGAQAAELSLSTHNCTNNLF